MAKYVRIADLPQMQQFVSSVATLLGVLAREGGDLPETARLAADQVKRDMAVLGGRDIGPPLAASEEDRIRDAMAEAKAHPGRTVTI